MKGPIGQEGKPPLRHQSGPNTSRQGNVQRLVDDALLHEKSGGAKGKAPAAMPGATGDAVAGKMPRGMSVVKWGGRLFIVGGLAWSAYRIQDAKPHERDRVVAGEVGGLLGGVLGPGGAVMGAMYGEYIHETATEGPRPTTMAFPTVYTWLANIAFDLRKSDPAAARMIDAAYDNDPAGIDYLMHGLGGVPWQGYDW